MNVGGTSASTPEVAGMFSIINDARLNKGLPTLGFFNPRLYEAAASNSALFVDVTSGVSSCGTDKCCDTGFEAISGWDSFTGFGQPVFSAWMDEFGSD
jgi:tripeptidyl-peptidase I